MVIMKKYRILRNKGLMIIVSIAVVFQFSSCSDLLDNNDKYYHVSTQEQQWNSLPDARAALFGVYGLMRAALGEENTYWAVGDLRMGDFTVRIREDLQAIRDNRLNAPFPNIQRIANWNRFYKVVNAAAVFIENAGKVLEKDDTYSESNYQYDIAQVRALRALAYFYMVKMWGDVPLITQAYDNGSFPKVPRTDAKIVLNYAKGELLEVATRLPAILGATSDLYYGGDANKWRGWLLGRYSIYGILAHIAAWEGNYVDVEAYASCVLDNASSIKASSTTVDNLVSSIGIFSSKYSNDYKGARLVTFGYQYDGTSVNEPTVEGHLESWTLAEPLIRKSLPDIYICKDSLYNIFMHSDTGDSRFGINESASPVRYYTNYIKGLEQEIPIFSKVCVVREGSASSSDFGVFGSFIVMSRIEDMILLRAEALTVLNRGDEALTSLNERRSARGLRTLSYLKDIKGDPKILLQEIFEERRRELMGEGHNWTDQVRRARLIGDNPKMVKLVSKDNIYWPIANEVLKANPEITQNEYWK